MLSRAASALLIAVFGALAFLGGAAPAAAAGGDCDFGFNPACEVIITPTPNPETPPSTDPVGSPGTFTPGPTSCTDNYGITPTEVPCTSEDGWWSNSRNCYIALQDPQRAPQDGESAAVGAWYTCAPPQCDVIDCGIRERFGYSYWSNTIPPGIDRFTPAQAASALVRTFQLRPITIGMAPESKTHDDDPAGTAPYRRSWVGIPVWLWVDEPQPLTFGPYTETATLGGVTVTATARVTNVHWTSGDGNAVNCGAGTRFDLAENRDRLATDSPSCGFRFQTAGTHTVDATSTWAVTWSGGGSDGNFASRTTTSSTQVQVGELQSVNTPRNAYER